MTDLVVIVPSRGRPGAAVELAQAFVQTEATSRLVFAVDTDDPTHDAYLAVYDAYDKASVRSGPAESNMVRTLNHVAGPLAEKNFALGFMGDDHRPRTKHWDAMYLAALDQLGTGIVYGDDLLQGERIPTQVAMTADIVRTLGFMAPPPLTHLFVDNYWRDLGTLTGCLRYLPNVVVEHMHPIAGKADWDAGHVRVNQQSMYQADAKAYQRYVEERMASDVAKVLSLRGAS